MLPGGAGALVQGQRTAAGLPDEARCPGPCTWRPFRSSGDPENCASSIRAASKGQGRQGGSGSGNAQAPAAPACRRPPRRPLDPPSRPTLLHRKPFSETLTINTDTPAKLVPVKTGSRNPEEVNGKRQLCIPAISPSPQPSPSRGRNFVLIVTTLFEVRFC